MLQKPSRTEAKASVAALLAGAMLPLSMAPWNWWPLGILSAGLLALLLTGSTPWSAFTRSLWFGVGQFSAGTSWVYVSISGYGEVPIPLAILMTTAFVALLAVVFAAPFTLLGHLKRRDTIALLFAFPAAWVASEWLRNWLFTGFPWLYLGYGHLHNWLSGWAPLIGVQGISWIAAFAGVALASAASWFHSRRTLIIGWVTVLIISLCGYWLTQQEWTEAVGDPIKVGMIQPALTLEQKWDTEEIIDILRLYQTMNETLLDNDLIVWPESAIPILKHYLDSYLADTADIMSANDTTLILGIPVLDPETLKFYNAITALGKGKGLYYKQRLVPFGEYVPFENYIRGSLKFFDLPMSSFSRGPRSQPLLTAGDLYVGTYICYEIAYPSLVTKTAITANLLITVSNDTWFGSSIGPNQHLQIAQMRALENAKPLIRTTNDGLSALVDHRGQLVEIAPQFVRTTLTGTLTPRRGATPFSQLGNLPIYLLAALSLLPCLWRFVGTIRHRTN